MPAALSRRGLLAAAATALATAAGCVGTDGAPAPAPNAPDAARYAYTHLRADGNRVLDGAGDVRSGGPVALDVDGTPAWLLAAREPPDLTTDASTAGPDAGAGVAAGPRRRAGTGGSERGPVAARAGAPGAAGTGAPTAATRRAGDTPRGSLWTVVAGSGTARTHLVRDGGSRVVADHGAVATPPVGYVADGRPGLLGAPGDAAAHTRPLPVDGGLLYVANDGDVVLAGGAETTRFEVAAPVDARPVAVGDGRYVLYGARTDRYRHGALGDTVEGSSLVVVDADGGQVLGETRLDAPAVFEGLSPLAADVDGDGDPEVVTTVADAADGARIRVYDREGRPLATGPVYGPGWRHQLCVAPFGPGGTPELAVVRKPHVDRTVEFYALDGRDDASDGGNGNGGGDGNGDGALDLRVTATREGYASHTYGSRTLDGGLAADLDADGRTELLVPTTDRTRLAAVRRTPGGTTAPWRLSLGGRLSTNVAGVALGDGRAAVGAGTSGGVRVWQG